MEGLGIQEILDNLHEKAKGKSYSSIKIVAENNLSALESLFKSIAII